MAEVQPIPHPFAPTAQAGEGPRGRLRIFFGAAEGVGTTYAMLHAARHLRQAGTEVVAGCIEPHGRLETERLLEGLEHIHCLPVRHRGGTRYELDLDAALARHPAILLVDELAHSNLVDGVPAPRHPRRWQDIQELLAAGIDVWTTLHVQQLESLSDQVYQITGMRSRETVPDRVFDEADDVDLIDLAPDELIERLNAGKVRRAGHASGTPERLMRRQNLLALREIALRRAADRQDALSGTLPAGGSRATSAVDWMPAAVGHGAPAEPPVRVGWRLAEALGAAWRRGTPAPHERPRADGTEAAVPARLRGYLWAVLVSVLCTLVCLAASHTLELPNIVMIYLAGVTIAGLWLRRGPSACLAVMNALAFDFFFVPPRYAFVIVGVQYFITFAVMLCIALVVATLTAHVREQTRVAAARERRTALLYAMSRELAATRGRDDMARVAVRHIADVFQCQAVVLLPDAGGRLYHPRQRPLRSSFRHADLAVAQWVLDHARRAGPGSDTLPAAAGLYLPLGGEAPAVGVLAVLPGQPRRVLLSEQARLLEAFSAQIALALERAALAASAEAASLAAERESLRNTLLASISHDLRTPLSVIAGAASTLAQQRTALEEPVRVDLARSIETKAREMSELVSNVLDLMRWQSGEIALRRDWQTLDDLVGSALAQVQDKLGSRDVDLRFPADLPPLHVDAQLIVQLFANLLDNIAKYTPEGTRVILAAAADGDCVRVTLDDEGPGLPAGDTERLFEKFQRGDGEGAVVGVGLGLAICRAIVRAHGGEIQAARRRLGGARFELTLPAGEGP
jgi:K+-sensing histidine kinase KdpD